MDPSRTAVTVSVETTPTSYQAASSKQPQPHDEAFDPNPAVVGLFNSTSQVAREELPRKPFEHDIFSYSQSPDPNWQPGTGATSEEWKKHETVEIDPHATDRDPLQNFGLLASGIIPRPIAMVSTLDSHGRPNLAPCSYFNVVGHDPPSFVIGFTNSHRYNKQTYLNIMHTGEATLSIANEWIADAANYAAINAPAGVSEWTLSGLTPAPTKVVKPARVAECVLSIETKLNFDHQLISSRSGKPNGNVVIMEAVFFHVRKDAYDAEKSWIRPEVIRPLSGMGGITWGRTTNAFEMKRKLWSQEVAGNEQSKEVLKKAMDDAKEGLKRENFHENDDSNDLAVSSGVATVKVKT